MNNNDDIQPVQMWVGFHKFACGTEDAHDAENSKQKRNRFKSLSNSEPTKLSWVNSQLPGSFNSTTNPPIPDWYKRARFAIQNSNGTSYQPGIGSSSYVSSFEFESTLWGLTSSLPCSPFFTLFFAHQFWSLQKESNALAS